MRTGQSRGVFALPFARACRNAEEGNAGGSTAVAPAATAPAPTQAAPAPVAPAQAPAAAPVASPAPVAPVVDASPSPNDPSFPAWLKDRLDQAKRSAVAKAYADLGVNDPIEAKAALERARSIAESSKTEEQKRSEELASLRARAAKADAYESTVKDLAASELARLPAAHQAIVVGKAGEDPQSILREIKDLQMILAAVAAVNPPTPIAPAAPVAPAVQRPLPAPASTVGAPAAPAPNAPAPTNHLDAWERMKETSPFAANAYFEKNERAIYAQIETRRKQSR